MTNHRSGLIRLILLIVIAILALSYFGINLRDIADSETGQSNFGYLKELSLKAWLFVSSIWDAYLRDQTLAAWDALTDLFARIKESLPLPND